MVVLTRDRFSGCKMLFVWGSGGRVFGLSLKPEEMWNAFYKRYFHVSRTAVQVCGVNVENVVTLAPVHSSIINIPGESTLRRDFLRLQLANKERSEALRRQQLEQQQNDEHKRQLLAERQKRIEEQKEQRRRLEEVRRQTVNIGVRERNRWNRGIEREKFCSGSVQPQG